MWSGLLQMAAVALIHCCRRCCRRALCCSGSGQLCHGTAYAVAVRCLHRMKRPAGEALLLLACCPCVRSCTPAAAAAAMLTSLAVPAAAITFYPDACFENVSCRHCRKCRLFSANSSVAHQHTSLYANPHARPGCTASAGRIMLY